MQKFKGAETAKPAHFEFPGPVCPSPPPSFELYPSSTGVAALGRGIIPWSDISRDSVLVGQGELCTDDDECDDGEECTNDSCDAASPDAGGDGCVHEFQMQAFADICLPYDPPNSPQPNLDDILCLLDDLADGPAVDGCGCNGLRNTTDLHPCPEDGGGARTPAVPTSPGLLARSEKSWGLGG